MSETTRSPHDASEGSVTSLAPYRRAPAPERPLGNLPVELSSFVGREREIAEIKKLLAQTRLLTLTGPGGCGKTRLALAAVSELSECFVGGAWWVGLAPLPEPHLVPQAVASALEVREKPNRSLTDTLVDALDREELLLVLDNCEHLIDACAALLDTLLRACPGARSGDRTRGFGHHRRDALDRTFSLLSRSPVRT